jgi:hypothetical protein
MGGARRFGPPRPSQQVGTYSVIGKTVLQLGRWEPFNSARRSRHWRRYAGEGTAPGWGILSTPPRSAWSGRIVIAKRLDPSLPAVNEMSALHQVRRGLHSAA